MFMCFSWNPSLAVMFNMISDEFYLNICPPPKKIELGCLERGRGFGGGRPMHEWHTWQIGPGLTPPPRPPPPRSGAVPVGQPARHGGGDLRPPDQPGLLRRPVPRPAQAPQHVGRSAGGDGGRLSGQAAPSLWSCDCGALGQIGSVCLGPIWGPKQRPETLTFPRVCIQQERPPNRVCRTHTLRIGMLKHFRCFPSPPPPQPGTCQAGTSPPCTGSGRPS